MRSNVCLLFLPPWIRYRPWGTGGPGGGAGGGPLGSDAGAVLAGGRINWGHLAGDAKLVWLIRQFWP
jgi:hypothetical protein